MEDGDETIKKAILILSRPDPTKDNYKELKRAFNKSGFSDFPE